MKYILTLSIMIFSFIIVNISDANEKKEKVIVDPVFEQFWKEFQKAIKAKDYDKICDMTHFPLKSADYTDEGEEIEISYNRDDFKKQFINNQYFTNSLKEILNIKAKDFSSNHNEFEKNDYSDINLSIVSEFDDMGPCWWNIACSKINGKYKLTYISLSCSP